MLDTSLRSISAWVLPEVDGLCQGPRPVGGRPIERCGRDVLGKQHVQTLCIPEVP